jgi:hypothetical protein
MIAPLEWRLCGIRITYGVSGIGREPPVRKNDSWALPPIKQLGPAMAAFGPSGGSHPPTGIEPVFSL